VTSQGVAGIADQVDLLESIPQLAWLAAADGTIQFFNQRWLEYTGVDVEAMQAEGVKGIVHPDELALIWQRWKRALQDGTPYEIEYRLKRKADGVYRWFLARAVPVTAGGSIISWVGTATDIDAQKRSNENLRFALEAADVLSSALDERAACQNLARLAVQQLADWCLVTLADGALQHRVIALEHKDKTHLQPIENDQRALVIESESELGNILRQGIPALFPLFVGRINGMQTHSLMIVPLASTNQKFGALVLGSAYSRRSFDQADLQVAQSVARRASEALQAARLFSEEKRTAQRMRFLAKAGETLFQSLDLMENFENLGQLLVTEVADLATVVTIENESVLRVSAIAHRDPEKIALVEALRGERTMSPERERRAISALRRHRPHVTNNIRTTTLERTARPYLLETFKALGPHSAITIPLHSRGATHGAIVAYYTDSGRTYSDDDIPMFVELGRRAAIAIENAQSYERERRVATTLQEASLPTLLPTIPGIRLDAVYKPGTHEAQIGGDWYDAFTLEDGSLVVTIGDVTGRGLQAAVIMGKIRQALGIVTLYERDPAKILNAADYILRQRWPGEIVTAMVAVINPGRDSVRFANAGHPFPLLRYHDGSIEELRSIGLPLGLRNMAESQPTQSHELASIGLLTFFTDGLTEWTHKLPEGEQRLRSILETDAVMHSPAAAHLISESCIHGGAQDDVAVLTLTLGTLERWSFAAENAKAAQDARQEFRRYLKRLAASSDEIAQAEIIFGELVANVVRHAPGAIEIEVDWTGRFPDLHVIDRGTGFKHMRALPELLSESGRGLFLVRRLARRFEVERIPGFGNHIVVQLPTERR